jgi:hypothetical protein
LRSRWRFIELLAVVMGGAGIFIANGAPEMPALGWTLVGIGFLVFVASGTRQRRDDSR